MSITLHGQALFTAIKNANPSDKIVLNNDGLSVVAKNQSNVTWKKGADDTQQALRVFLREMGSILGQNQKPILSREKSSLMMQDLVKLPLTMKTLKKAVSYLEGNRRDTHIKGPKAALIKFGVAIQGLWHRLFSSNSGAKSEVEALKNENKSTVNKPTDNKNRIWSKAEARMQRIERDKGFGPGDEEELKKTK